MVITFTLLGSLTPGFRGIDVKTYEAGKGDEKGRQTLSLVRSIILLIDILTYFLRFSQPPCTKSRPETQEMLF